MRKSIFVLFLGIIISLSSCRKDFDTSPSMGNLEFSQQTVYLDTVFTDIGSSTYTLKVYNRGSKDITIPAIRLAKANSKYRLMVDGMTGLDADNNGQGDGKVFSNVELLAKDSLFIFIETTANIADANPTDFLYTDEIEFTSVNGTQKVNLVTLIQDAVFLYPAKDDRGNKEKLLLGIDDTGAEVYVNGFELDANDPIHGDEFHFTNEKPYVIYGFAGIPNGKQLVIDAGAHVHFHADSGLIVQPGGTLSVGQDWTPPADPLLNPFENEVIFEGDRLEPGFSETPGQWLTVWMRNGSLSNINHLTLKNATVGMLIEEATANITNSQIYNSSSVGLLGRNATMVTANNTVVNLAGQACVASVSGGNYDFRHCTFNNNWGSPDQVAVNMSNYENDANNNPVPSALNMANFFNCIIYGTNRIELLLDKVDGAAFNTNFKHCLVKFNDAGTSIAGLGWYDPIRYSQNENLINQDPLFKNANANQLNIFEDSPAHQYPGENEGILTDILGTLRSPVFDLGAYQSVPMTN